MNAPSRRPEPLSSACRLGRLVFAATIFSGALGAIGSVGACASGQCFVRFKKLDSKGNVVSDKCVVDTCPKGAEYVDARSACECKPPTVTFNGACVTEAEANASCGVGYVYANAACVARTCAPGQVVNTQTGACENKAQSDQAVAAQAGVKVGAGQAIGCPPNFTYVINGTEGACVPNELTCGAGTKYEGGKCVAVACAAGTVLDANGQCVTLKSGSDQQAFSVQTKLTSALGPQFCAQLARNPAGFKVQPGQATTVRVALSIRVPGRDTDKTELASVRTMNAGGAELTPQLYPGVTQVNKQVEQVVAGIRALGGKSIEESASAEATCVIRRAPIQVIETHGGGV